VTVWASGFLDNLWALGVVDSVLLGWACIEKSKLLAIMPYCIYLPALGRIYSAFILVMVIVLQFNRKPIS
jgi:hypothetical protein